MSNYLQGVDIQAALPQAADTFGAAVLKALADLRPMSADAARNLIALTAALLEQMAGAHDDVDDEEIASWMDTHARELAGMSASLEASGLAQLPDHAADILCETVADVLERYSHGINDAGKAALIQRLAPHGAVIVGRRTAQERVHPYDLYEEDDVLGARTKQTFRTTLGPRGHGLYGDDDAIGVFDDAILEDEGFSDEILGFDEEAFTMADDVIGMFDIQARQRDMNTINPVTVTIARSLVAGGSKVIAVAQTVSASRGLPDTNTLKTTAGHLAWHAAKLATLKDGKALYDSGDDLKKWVMQAFIESNAVEEGAAYLDEAWNQMWSEIGAELATLPRKALALPGKALEAATGVPWWLWYVGIAAGVGLVGYGAYKILAGPAGGALVGAYLGRR